MPTVERSPSTSCWVHCQKAMIFRCSTESSKKACGCCRLRRIRSGSTPLRCNLARLICHAGRASFLRRSSRITWPTCIRSRKGLFPIAGITLRPSPYAYHPFGAGPRLCIGAPLATAVIRIALQRILTTFRLSAVPGSDISAHIESTMLFPTHGVPMQIHPADGKFASSPIMGNIHDLVDFDEIPDVAVHEARRG